MKLLAYACASEKPKPRGDALKGVMANLKNSSNRKSSNIDNSKTATSDTVNFTDTLCGIVRNNSELFNMGRTCISGYISKNATIEMDKAIAINIMASAIENLGMNIVEAAEFAGQVCGHSGQIVRRWAFSFFTSISAYSCLEDVDDDLLVKNCPLNVEHHL